MKVLIGYDGSDCSEAAIYDLHRAGLPADVEAVVMTSADVSPNLPSSCYEPADPEALAKKPQIIHNARLLAQSALAEAKRVAARGVERVLSEFPTWKVSAATAGDYSPYRALVHKADEWHPDLLVVGSHGRSAAARVLLGSVAQNVLAHAACSVRIARFRELSGRPESGPVCLVLGIDGSPDSAAAASAIAERPWPTGCQVLVIVAVDPLTSMALAYGPSVKGFGPVVGPGGDILSRARDMAKSVAKELRREGLSAVSIVQEGNPKQVLLREAEACRADCIFLGAKGHGRMERFLLGSVSAAVAARATCAVEVVRQG